MDLQHLGEFELRQICYFLVVVECGNNFSEAAARLGIKQPPLSQRISALEASLGRGQKNGGVKLFDRGKRPIELTEAGRVFLAEARRAIVHLDRAVTRARRAERGQIGRLIVGINNSIANSGLSDVLRTFRQQFPDVELMIREVSVEREVRMLENRDLDLIFQRSPSFERNGPNLMSRPILEEYFVVALPTDHALAGWERIPLEALKDESIILPSVQVLPSYEQVIELCRQKGFEPKLPRNIEVTGAVALLGLVAAGIGISILPNHVQALQREGIVYRPVQNTALTRQIAVVWRRDDRSSVLLRFLEILQEVMGLSLLDSW